MRRRAQLLQQRIAQAAARGAVVRATQFGDVDDDIDAVDAVDLELFPIFEEEALELLPKLDGQLREWAAQPETAAHPAACAGAALACAEQAGRGRQALRLSASRPA